MELDELERGGAETPVETVPELDDLLETEGVTAQTPTVRRTGKPPKKRGAWPVFAGILAAVLTVSGMQFSKNWQTIQLKADPAQGVAAGLDMVKPLPSPLSLGLLGQFYQGDDAYDFSGTANLSADGDGLRVSLTDLTVAGGETDVTFSAYLSSKEAILSCPTLTGGDAGWYGVRLDVPLADQAAGTGGDPGYGWYFGETQMDALQKAADTASLALSGVKEISLTKEKEAFAEFARGLDFTVTETATGYVLTAQATGEDMEALAELGLPAVTYREAEIAVYLNKSGAVVAVEVDSGEIDLRLDLGSDPQEELTPRLSATWSGGDSAAMLTLAGMVSEGTQVEPPQYVNAFSLLPYIEGAVKEP